jgi:hypothetical protein
MNAQNKNTKAGCASYHLSECRKVFENQNGLEAGIRAGFAVLSAHFIQTTNRKILRKNKEK